MTYLDYSATTMVDSRVLKCFDDSFLIYKDDFSAEEKMVQELLNTDKDVLFTSGSTESNNAAIMGIAKKYKTGRIISTRLEHSSVDECLKFLEKEGFVIDYVPLKNGIIDIDEFKSLLGDDVILVTIASVSSEIGFIQPVSLIGSILKSFPHIVFHCDMTQSIGKINIPLDNIDLVSFAPHKFYGMKGIGCLLKKSDISLVPILYGERKYNYALIRSLVCALSLIIPNVDCNYDYVKKLNDKLVANFKKYDGVHVNSNDNCVPHILNVSVDYVKPEVFLHMLESYDIYISTKSACAKTGDASVAVLTSSGSIEYAMHSIRISLSYKTTKEDIDKFMKAFDVCYQKMLEIMRKM